MLEVHEGGDADNPLKQFVWDIRYIDAPVVRFHDGDTDGTIDDTLYYTTDANDFGGHNTIFHLTFPPVAVGCGHGTADFGGHNTIFHLTFPPAAVGCGHGTACTRRRTGLPASRHPAG